MQSIFVFLCHDDPSLIDWRREGEVGMVDAESAPIRHIDNKRLKWHGVEKFADALFHTLKFST